VAGARVILGAPSFPHFGTVDPALGFQPQAPGQGRDRAKHRQARQTGKDSLIFRSDYGTKDGSQPTVMQQLGIESAFGCRGCKMR
jgi:hypothetical protein